MKKTASKGNSGGIKLGQLMKLPMRALVRARDYYVRCMVECTQVSRCPGAHGVGSLPRSFSVASSTTVLDDHRSEDFRELVRAASVRTLIASRSRVVRSGSMGFGIGISRIDEEKGFEVDGDLDDDTRKLRCDEGESGGFHGSGGRKQSVVFWRSKSYAVPAKGIAF